MTIPPDAITLKKLVLVRQLYQRAILHTAAQHSYVDRIIALIGLDLTNETVLKAVVGSLLPSQQPKNDFQGILKQADDALIANGLSEVPDKVKIQHVRTLRNDAQHKARYPNDSDVNDCRTYTRDFLQQLMKNVWGKSLESVSLVENIQNKKVQGYLKDAEEALSKGEYRQAVIKTLAAFGWTFSNVKSSLAGRMPRNIRAFVVTDGFGEQSESVETFEVFDNMRHTLMRSVIGLSFAGNRRFFQITRKVGSVVFMADGEYQANATGHMPSEDEAQYVIEFATDSVLQIESLVGDIEKPFEP